MKKNDDEVKFIFKGSADEKKADAPEKKTEEKPEKAAAKSRDAADDKAKEAAAKSGQAADSEKTTAAKPDSGAAAGSARPERPQKKHGSGKKKGLLILIIVLAALAVVYLGFSIFFRSHFYFRSTVNGQKASAATPAEVLPELKKEARDYTLTVTDDDRNATVITPDEIDLDLSDADDGLEKLLQKQSGFGWIGALAHPVHYRSDMAVSYDAEKLDDALSKLPAVTNAAPVASEDATYAYADGKFSVQDEVYGNQVDTAALQEQAAKCVTALTQDLDLRKDHCYIEPQVLSDDEKLASLVEAMNKKLAFSFTYTVDGMSEPVPKATIASWLSEGDGGTISYNEDAIKSFVASMADKYNTVGKPMTIHSVTGSDITVRGGTYGYRIDQAGETKQIEADLDAEKDVSRDFVYSQTAMGGRSGPGNLYIEVNVTGQHFYVVQNGQVVLESDVVTGNPNTNHSTDRGCWFIQFMRSPDILDGYNDDGTAYHTKVSCWMPFYNGEGFHDATWQPSFGGTYYKVRGSHGCVNLPLSVAKQLYSIVKPGTPVFVYDLPGTENNAPNVKDAKAMTDRITENTDALSNLTLDQNALVSDLWKQWKKLTPEAKAMVTNASVLTTAHDTMNAIKAENGLPTD